MKTYTYDIVIVGAGGAGMQAALNASKSGSQRVCVITKVFPTRSHTGAAQGGMNAVLQHADAADSTESHVFDTIKGSDYLADQDAVEFFSSGMPDVVLELESMGVAYSRDKAGRIAQRKFGGASHPRCCYAQDKTGHLVLHALYENCLKNNVTFLDDFNLLDVAVDENGVQGIVALDMRKGEVALFEAKCVVLCTGGFGRIYWSRTTNATNMTGDGVAAAMRAGVPIKDAEMVQFHPTGLAKAGILLSEACRGEGGYLLNSKGERFMKRYAPQKMELAARDVVARSIETEIKEGRGFGQGMQAYVLLDMRHLGEKLINERLPQVRKLALKFEGVDMAKEPVPVRPANHYSMGGIDVIDYKTCATKISGLFAAGECSNISVHGANRLGANSLSEVCFFGKCAGIACLQEAKERACGKSDVLYALGKSWEERFLHMLAKSSGVSCCKSGTASSSKNGIHIYELREKMATALWEGAGIFRDETGLKKALQKIDECIEQYESVYIKDTNKIYNSAFINYVELGNLLVIARSVCMGALMRKESRGSHFRSDFTNRDDEHYLKHSLITLHKNGKFSSSWRDVAITKYAPQERVY